MIHYKNMVQSVSLFCDEQILLQSWFYELAVH